VLELRKGARKVVGEGCHEAEFFVSTFFEREDRMMRIFQDLLTISLVELSEMWD
jgi:hypothetical protein